MNNIVTDKNIVRQYNKAVRPIKKHCYENWTVNKHQSFTLLGMVQNCEFLLGELECYAEWCLNGRFTKDEFDETILSLNTFVAQYKSLI